MEKSLYDKNRYKLIQKDSFKGPTIWILWGGGGLWIFYRPKNDDGYFTNKF